MKQEKLVESLVCEQCGAPLDLHGTECKYCHTAYIVNPRYIGPKIPDEMLFTPRGFRYGNISTAQTFISMSTCFLGTSGVDLHG